MLGQDKHGGFCSTLCQLALCAAEGTAKVCDLSKSWDMCSNHHEHG